MTAQNKQNYYENILSLKHMPLSLIGGFAISIFLCVLSGDINFPLQGMKSQIYFYTTFLFGYIFTNINIKEVRHISLSDLKHLFPLYLIFLTVYGLLVYWIRAE